MPKCHFFDIMKTTMKYPYPDIVYFVKDSAVNEELTYSVRSVVENFYYRRIIFIGGCPYNLKPDVHIKVDQPIANTKWENTNLLMETVVNSPMISKDFVLFNDDFFVMSLVRNLPIFYDGTLEQRCEDLLARYTTGDKRYRKNLEQTISLLQSKSFPTLNYAVHYPMLINRKKMEQTMETFPNGLMWRSIYGNMWVNPDEAQRCRDCKIINPKYCPSANNIFLSTNDKAFSTGLVGEYIRKQFLNRCKYECRSQMLDNYDIYPPIRYDRDYTL